MSTEALISIYEVCHDVAAEVEMRPLLERILSRIMDLVKAERGFITLVGSDGPRYDDAVQRISPQDYAFSRDFEVFSRSTVRHALETRSLVSKSIQENWGQATDSMRVSGCRYVMAAALQANDEAVGVLYVDARQARTSFSEEDELLVRILAEQAAIAIRQARLQEPAAGSEVESGIRFLAESAPQGVLIVEDGRVSWCNPTIERCFGSNLTGLQLQTAEKSSPITEAANQPVDWLGALQRVWSESRRAGTERDERSVRLADGRVRTLEMLAHRYLVGQTEAVGIVVSDVTDRREEEARRFGAQRMESVRLLAAGIAHEFNNSLAIILGNADLLLTNAKLDESGQDSVRAIMEAVARGSSVSQQLLAFTGRVPAYRVAFDLGPLIEEVTRSLQYLAPGNVHVALRQDPEPMTVVADRDQIRQALMNLALNAVEAMAGGGSLTLEMRFEDPFAIVLISDTGAGIAHGNQHRIFEPFFTTRGPQRTGLGLSTSYGILQSHRGTLAFETSPGGTVFKAALPASRKLPVVERGPATPTSPPWSGKGEKVLFVDDEPRLRTFGVRAMQALGLEALTAGDGREALWLFGEHKDIRVVVLDLAMPNMGGEECLRLLRIADPTVPVLISSGSLTESEVQGLLAQGATGVLTKPFSLNVLRLALQRVLEPSAEG